MASTNRLSPIPHPPKKPVVGNMLSLDSSAPTQNLARLAKELGPIFWLDMMGTPFVVVSGHDLVDELSDEKRFDKAVKGSLRRVRAVAGDGLFTAYTNEPNWSKAHNILMQPFGNRAMQSYHPSMVDIAEQLVKKWERLNADEEIDVVHDMTALTLDTIGLCGFDYRFNSFYRVAGAFARDHHVDPRPSARRALVTQPQSRPRKRCRVHERDGRRDRRRTAQERRSGGRQERHARRHDDRCRPRHRRAAR